MKIGSLIGDQPPHLRIGVVIATCGEPEWASLAWDMAFESVRQQHGCDDVDVTVRVEHYPDVTVPVARNLAAERLDTDWLIFLDADDTLAPGYLCAMAKAYRERYGDEAGHQAMFVPDVSFVDPEGPTPARCLLEPGMPLYERSWAVIGTMIPATMYRSAGGFPDEPIYEDWILWMRLHYDHRLPMIPVHDAVYVATRKPGGRNLAPDAEGIYWKYRNFYEAVVKQQSGVVSQPYGTWGQQ